MHLLDFLTLILYLLHVHIPSYSLYCYVPLILLLVLMLLLFLLNLLQNYEISQEGKGKEITIQELADIFIKQQERNVQNVNLVTPTSYVPQIIEAN